MPRICRLRAPCVAGGRNTPSSERCTRARGERVICWLMKSSRSRGYRAPSKRARVCIDARKWWASKVNKKDYGDRVSEAPPRRTHPNTHQHGGSRASAGVHVPRRYEHDRAAAARRQTGRRPSWGRCRNMTRLGHEADRRRQPWPWAGQVGVEHGRRSAAPAQRCGSPAAMAVTPRGPRRTAPPFCEGHPHLVAERAATILAVAWERVGQTAQGPMSLQRCAARSVVYTARKKRSSTPCASQSTTLPSGTYAEL